MTFWSFLMFTVDLVMNKVSYVANDIDQPEKGRCEDLFLENHVVNCKCATVQQVALPACHRLTFLSLPLHRQQRHGEGEER